MSIDSKLKEIYIKKYPINHVAKHGHMVKSPIEYIVGYEKEVIDIIKSRSAKGSKVRFTIDDYGLRDHIYTSEDEASKTHRLDKTTFDICYITYTLIDSNGDTEVFDKEFLLHQIGDRSDYWVRGIHLYIAPIVSDAIMAKKPDGTGVLTRFRREKQILTPLNMVMSINGRNKNVRVSYNEKPFKLIALEEKSGFNSRSKSPTILMAIYAKGLEHILSKYYKCGLEDFTVFDGDKGLDADAEDGYSIIKGTSKTSRASIRCLNNHKLHQLATAILHVVDLYPIVMDMIIDGDVNWEARSSFLTVLVGKSILHNTCPTNSLRSMLDKQEEFISAYMTDVVKTEFERINYKFEDIYDYYATSFYDYDSLLYSDVKKNYVHKHKRIESLYYLYSNIINSVNKEFEHALKDLEDGKLKSAVRRVKSTIFKNSNTTIKSSNSLAVYTYTAIGDAFPLTVANITSLQELGSGNNKSTGPLDTKKESIMDIEPQHLLFGNSYYITNSSTNPILTHNIHCQFEADGSPIYDEKFAEKLSSSLGKLES